MIRFTTCSVSVSSDPAHILVGREGIFVPFIVGEAEGDIVAQLVVFEQQFQLGHSRGTIEVIGTLPPENVFGTLGDAALETHIGHHAGYLVGVYQLGVTEHFGALPEELFDFVVMLLDLQGKLLGSRSEASEWA